MIVAAIDSAEVSGLAVVYRDDSGAEELWLHDTIRIATAGDVEVSITRLLQFRPTVFAVEEPFFAPRAPAAGMALAILLGRWLQACQVRDLATVTVPPSMWQAGVLAGITSRSRSAERKLASVAFAKATFGIELQEDAADAVALAAYVARNASVKGKAA